MTISARRREKPDPPRPMSLDDKWCAEVREKCARDMAKWLKGTVNTMRPINSLSMAELQCCAQSVISMWIACATDRLYSEPPPPDFDDLHLLLM